MTTTDAARPFDLPVAVRAAWSAVLEHDAFSDTDDFFDVGGHSLLAARIMARLSRQLGVRLSVRTMFDNPTVSDLVAAVEQVVTSGRTRPEVST